MSPITEGRAIAALPTRARRRLRSGNKVALTALVVGASCAVSALLTAAPFAARTLVGVADGEQLQGGGSRGLDDDLSAVLRDIEPLRDQVASGSVVAKFGEKASQLVSAAGPELAPAVDGMLQSLFLQQLSLLRLQTAAKFVKGDKTAEAVGQADQAFCAAAADLIRTGSGWSYDQERYALRATLEGAFRADATLADEQTRAAQTQQNTVQVIGKLQSQMEALQQRVQQMRSGSPWFLSTSYRIPKTPLTLIGRYQQGRANLELNLNSDRDPACADAGFVEGVGPANLGLGLSVGS